MNRICQKEKTQQPLLSEERADQELPKPSAPRPEKTALSEADLLKRRKAALLTKKWRESNRERSELAIKRWRKENPEKLKIYRIRSERKNRDKIRARKRPYELFRYRNDPVFRLRRLARCRYRDILKSKGKSKRLSTFKALGCTPDYLKLHLESLFKIGMTWANYGEWEIDHIIPLGRAHTIGEIEKLSHYTNLQPMWRSENRSKSAGGTLAGCPDIDRLHLENP